MNYLKNKFLHKISIIYYDWTDVSEGIGVKKTNESKECDICKYWYFLNIVLNFNQMSAMDAMIY